MLVDLTLPIDSRIPVFPGNPCPEIKQISTIDKNGWNEKQFLFTSHFSTHVDAPRHMIQDGKTLSDYPIDSFIGNVIMFDVRGQSRIRVDVSKVKKDDIVFFHTDHISHIYEKDYFNTNPVIAEETIHALIKKKISILGIDSFSPDNDPFLLHKLLFSQDIRIVENLVHLERISQKRFFCYIFPLPIKDADGAPCRVVAEVK